MNSMAALASKRRAPPKPLASPRRTIASSDSAFGASRRIAGQAEQRQHQLQVGRRPDRKELVGFDEIGRIAARVLRQTAATTTPGTPATAARRRRPARRSEMRCGAPNAAPARTSGASSAGCPGTSAGRAAARRAGSAAPARSCLRARRRPSTFQPARRIRAASTKSCDRISPDSDPSPSIGARAQCFMKGSMRRIALWPQ